MAAKLLRIYQRSGLQAAARATGILKLLGLAERDLLLPPVDRHFFFDQLGKTLPARGTRRARVAFFAGCVANVTFTALNEATIRVLTANGSEVIVRGAQLSSCALPSPAVPPDAHAHLPRSLCPRL